MVEKIVPFTIERIPARLAGVYALLYSGTDLVMHKRLFWYDPDCRFFIVRLLPHGVHFGGAAPAQEPNSFVLFDIEVYERSEMQRTGALKGRGHIGSYKGEWNSMIEQNFRGIINSQAGVDTALASDQGFKDPFQILETATEAGKTIQRPGDLESELDK